MARYPSSTVRHLANARHVTRAPQIDMTYNFSQNFAGRISVERAALFVA
jgi:hypothetical protein